MDEASYVRAVQNLVDELDRRLRRVDENGEATDDEADPNEILQKLIIFGWGPRPGEAGQYLLHELTGDETFYPFAAVRAIEWLLDHGADVNLEDDNGMTPLHFAALTGLAIVDTLLKRGANASLKTTRPASVALYAARGLLTIPSGSTAYDLALGSELPVELIEALRQSTRHN